MTANQAEIGRNPKIATVTGDPLGVDTLDLTAGVDNSSPNEIQWGRNPILASDLASGIQKLKVIYV